MRSEMQLFQEIEHSQLASRLRDLILLNEIRLSKYKKNTKYT